MKKYQLYKLIQANEELKDKRHPMFEKNRFMKFLAIFMWLYYAAILIFLGVMMPMGMKGAYAGVSAFHVLDGWFPVVIMLDFWLRFILQETPSQRCKPYSLLPIRRSFLMNLYLIQSGLAWGNLFWFFMLVPFGLIAVATLLGWGAFFGWLLGWWLLIVADGFAYLLVRALCIRHMAWALVPALIHAVIIGLMVYPDHNPLDMPCTELMYGFTCWKVFPYLGILCIIGLLYWANYWFQGKMLYDEVGKKEEVALKHTTQMNFLNRFGIVGEYLKLEMKMRIRNKQVRLQFIVGMGCMIMFALLMNFTPAYDTPFMKSFICLYDYVVLGLMTLAGIMCYEGNYIDGLMSRRESIYQLLIAKYYINTLFIIIPLLILIPNIIIGKISFWMNLGYLFFTAGVIYPILFQLAVYNKNTLPLNVKLTGAKQGNMTQQMITLAAMFLPIGVEKLCTLLLGDPWGYILLIAFGLVGICTHKLWIGNIYKRFMKRRYINMEGFRASRNSY